jgi:hypothetical protein
MSVRRRGSVTQLRIGHLWITFGRWRVIAWYRHVRLTPLRWWRREG